MLLKELLNSCTVKQLKSLVSNWDIKGVSRLNKRELMDKLNNCLLDENRLSEMLLHLEPDEWDLLHSGQGRFMENDEHIYLSALFLLDHGLIVPKNDVDYEVPTDILKLLKQLDTPEFKHKFERLVKIRKYALAFIELYGIIPAEKAAEIYCSQTGDELTGDDLLKMAVDRIRPLKYTILYKDYLGHEALWAVCDDDSEAQQLLKKQMDKPYYIPPQQQLLKYADSNYFEHNEQYNVMKDYLRRHFSLNDNILEDVCSDIQLACQMESDIQHIFYQMDCMGVRFKDRKQTEGFFPYLYNLMNHSRLWANQGHTPSELNLKHSQSIKMENEYYWSKKVGRNDPCPCGSGKKYKKCCGR